MHGHAILVSRFRRLYQFAAIPLYKRRNQRDTSNHMTLVWLFGFDVPTNDSQQCWWERQIRHTSAAPSARGGGRRRLSGLHLRHSLLVEGNEIHGVEQERRKSAVAHRGRDDLAREREQEPRTLDHDERLQRFRRHVLDTENAREGQIEGKQYGAGALRLAVQFECNFIVGFSKLLHPDIDLNLDRRLGLTWRERARSIRILE